MRVALIYPPSCDPTAPYLSIPTLTAWLRRHHIEVLPIDANLEAWECLLAKGKMLETKVRLEKRLADLDSKTSLGHQEQLDYVALWNARAEAHEVPNRIDNALAVLRNKNAFFDPQQYEHATSIVEAAQRVIAAAYSPLSLDFVSYRTPFSLTNPAEIELDSTPARNPFYDYFQQLASRLLALNVDLIGISVAFPGQIQPAYSLALILRSILHNVHITAGGPALSQIVLRQKSPENAQKACFAFDSVVVGEGEIALLQLAKAIENNEKPSGIIQGTRIEDLASLPSPDFDGLPLDRYLSPELVLPYDPSRGCYWGVCAFCHYGLSKTGTARYRQRPVNTIVDHLESLSKRHETTTFYLSQDVLSPGLAKKLGAELINRKLDLKWGSDIRPERSLSQSWCDEIAKGGAICVSVGVESASDRVLSLIDKGVRVSEVESAIRNLDQAGIAVEAMCFSNFPTESGKEALDTIRFLEKMRKHVSLFILGKFDLSSGSIVAQKPSAFGIAETWTAKGDEFCSVLFFREAVPPKRERDYSKIDDSLSNLSAGWQLRHYPWAGALSTAHTLLWYRRYGRAVFRKLSSKDFGDAMRGPVRETLCRYDLEKVAEDSVAVEEGIWASLIQEKKEVSRLAYERLATRSKRAKPSATTVKYGLDIGIEVLKR